MKNVDHNVVEVETTIWYEVQCIDVVVDSPIDSWILDLEASFHTTTSCGLMENYVVGNYGKKYLTNGGPIRYYWYGWYSFEYVKRICVKNKKVKYVPRLM